jgi:hypothetical protein
VEILVAVSILALAIMTIFQVFIVAYDSRLRAEDYTKAVVVAIDAMEMSAEMGVPLDESGSLSEERREFTWEFHETDVDIEDYPKLKEISLDSRWQEGRRNGRYILTTYFWNPVLD